MNTGNMQMCRQKAFCLESRAEPVKQREADGCEQCAD